MVYPPNASTSSHHLFCFWPTHSVTISSSPHSSPSLEIQNGGLIFCKGHTEHVTTVLIKISLHCCRLSIPFYMASVLIKPNWIGAFKQDPFCTKSIFFLFMILYQCFFNHFFHLLTVVVNPFYLHLNLQRCWLFLDEGHKAGTIDLHRYSASILLIYCYQSYLPVVAVSPTDPHKSDKSKMTLMPVRRTHFFVKNRNKVMFL